MKYGIREICDVVLKAKANNTEIGNKTFNEGEPVLYFDTLKTSSMEGAATTVYAQGGRGNSRLVAWEGERTATFTMEDALISDMGLAVLTGAGLIDASATSKLAVHTTAKFGKNTNGKYKIDEKVAMKNSTDYYDVWVITMDKNDDILKTEKLTVTNQTLTESTAEGKTHTTFSYTIDSTLTTAEKVMFDFYVEKASGARQIEITPDKFGGNYYLEASTLFRDQNGKDMPAEFIIPNCKVQSNFNFSLASTGDPSTFTFTMDAFPDYTVYDPTKKVLSVIQVIADEAAPLADIETVTV